MTNFIKNFARDENGAVTVDWVVLTAAVVGLAVAAYSSIQTGASNLTAATDTTLGSMTVGSVDLTGAVSGSSGAGAGGAGGAGG